jgi:hypothetical protein
MGAFRPVSTGDIRLGDRTRVAIGAHASDLGNDVRQIACGHAVVLAGRGAAAPEVDINQNVGARPVGNYGDRQLRATASPIVGQVLGAEEGTSGCDADSVDAIANGVVARQLDDGLRIP